MQTLKLRILKHLVVVSVPVLQLHKMKKWTLFLNFLNVLHFSYQWNLGSGFFLLYSTILRRSIDRFLLPIFPSIWKECVDIKNLEEKKTLHPLKKVSDLLNSLSVEVIFSWLAPAVHLSEWIYFILSYLWIRTQST